MSQPKHQGFDPHNHIDGNYATIKNMAKDMPVPVEKYRYNESHLVRMNVRVYTN